LFARILADIASPSGDIKPGLYRNAL